MSTLDFHHFTTESRQALFAARIIVSEQGSANVDCEHLLLGILRIAPVAVTRFSTPAMSTAELQGRVLSTLPHGQRTSVTSEELPIAPALNSVLRRTMREAETLSASDIRPEHLVLALLSDDASTVSPLLRELGLSRESIIAFLREQ